MLASFAGTSRRGSGSDAATDARPDAPCAFGLSPSPLLLCPWAGGVLELSGVFGGSPSLASSSATRVRSTEFSATRASIRPISARAKLVTG